MMDCLMGYDRSNPSSIEAYAQRLIGKTFRDVIEEDSSSFVMLREETVYGSYTVSDTKRNKGNLGQIIEEKFFHYACNNDSSPDFTEAGVELKVTPYKEKVRGGLAAKERLILTMIDYFQVVKEEWEDSTFGNYLRETRFLFVVYKFGPDNVLRLRGCQFWNIPYEDLEIEVRSVWEKTKQVLIDGLDVTVQNGVRKNNFPKASENRVSHVRPHALNAEDTYELPDGRRYPKQCFWLNNTYIYEQLNEKIKVNR